MYFSIILVDFDERLELIKSKLASVFATKDDLNKLSKKSKETNEEGSSSSLEKMVMELKEEFESLKGNLLEGDKEAEGVIDSDSHRHSDYNKEVTDDKLIEGNEAEDNETDEKKIEEKKEGTEESEGGSKMVGIKLPTTTRTVQLSNIDSQKMIKLMNKRMKAIENNMGKMDVTAENIETKIKELNEKIEDLNKAMTKKAAVLDMKSAMGSIGDLNEKNVELANEINKLKKQLKSVSDNEELKLLKSQVTSLDSKLTFGLKNVKDIQSKLAIISSFQGLSPDQSPNEEKDETKDELNHYIEETNEKIAQIKSNIENLKKSLDEISNTSSEALNSKASADSVVELENKIYKELDKVLYTLGKRISNDENKKDIIQLQIQIKRLYDMYMCPPGVIKESTEEALLVKKSFEGISCASCDKGVNDIYGHLNQSQDYSSWGKFPLKDTSMIMPKVNFIIM